MKILRCTGNTLRSGRPRFAFVTFSPSCTRITLVAFISFVTLHFRPSISGKRIAVCRREVGVLADVSTRSLAAICRKGRTVVTILDVQITCSTIRSGWSRDTLISLDALRTFQLYPFIRCVSSRSGRTCCNCCTNVGIRGITHRIAVRISGVLHMKILRCTGNTLRSGRSRFTFVTFSPSCPIYCTNANCSPRNGRRSRRDNNTRAHPQIFVCTTGGRSFTPPTCRRNRARCRLCELLRGILPVLRYANRYLSSCYYHTIILVIIQLQTSLLHRLRQQ